MFRRINARQSWILAVAALAVLVFVQPAAAQTGRVQGVVTDAAGKPVEGATITVTQVNGSSKYTAKTDKNGEYLQIGLIGGTTYTVMVAKDNLTAQRDVPIRGQGFRANFILEPDNKDGLPKAGPNAAQQLQQMFSEGLELSRAGKHDEAIAKFNAVASVNAKCSDCFYNIGYSAAQKKDYPAAEAAFKKAIEIKPDYADAYTGLANIYNAQRKFDLASEASAKALEFSGGGGLAAAPIGGAPGVASSGNADALFNQGVTLWNGGKIAEAKKQFEAAIAANPNHAEAHYQLAMALVNEGNLKGASTEFDTYLKLSPNGPNAPTAKALMAQLPK